MKILITGATGYLGSKLLKNIIDLPENHHITIIKRSFSSTFRINSIKPSFEVFNSDKESLPNLFKKNDFELILHCATNYGRRSLSHLEMLESNLLLPLSLLELGVKHGVKNFINTDTMLDKGINAYSLSKKQFRDWLKYFSHSINATTILLEHFYGPLDDETKFTTNIIRSLINNTPSIDLTKGNQKRDFIYIDDVISAFTCILDNLRSDNVGYSEYEVGSGTSVSIKEFVSLAKTISENQSTILNFGAIPYRENEPGNIQVDTSKLFSLGWRPKIDLKTGLKLTFNVEKSFIL